MTTATAVQVIFDNYMKGWRPTSPAFKAGVIEVLRRRFDESLPRGECPYPLGSSDADAWFFGGRAGVEAWERRAEYLS